MIDKDTNWEAYIQGRQASIDHDGDPTKATNPYEEGSIAWQSWNAGWGSHWEECWRYE